jgi:hypothetical protein
VLTVLIILAVVLVVVMAISLMGAGPSRVIRRRTIVERRPATRRVVEEPVAEGVVEERVVDEPPATRRVVE